MVNPSIRTNKSTHPGFRTNKANHPTISQLSKSNPSLRKFSTVPTKILEKKNYYLIIKKHDQTTKIK